ncbi:helix-turn-helix domain-containing protein [Thiotrichales bacterium 19S9-12]|nr:helix-turn-helix domain-containing protein [Thiotrichales bacterium 19S9-11]MCF6811779.1 helix-turn-helix domain-containing protein [Thiotrichales bacterium 19S9-12]
MSKYKFKSLDQLEKELLTADESAQLNAEVEAESKAILARQELANDVMRYKEKNHLTLDALAEKLGTSKSQANRILKAKASYSLETIYRICRIIGKRKLTLKIY